MARIQRIIEWLPPLGQPLMVRIGFASLVMSLAIGLELALRVYVGLPGLTPLLFGVLVTAVLFDKRTGIHAAALACIGAYNSIVYEGYSTPLIAAMAMFAGVSVSIALFGEGLRLALESAKAGRRDTEVLLHELQHRTQNTLAIIVAMLELQARASANPDVKSALGAAADRVSVQSEAYRQLELREARKLSVSAYIGTVCRLLEQSIGGLKHVRILCHTPDIMIDAQRALALGLIVNELITNCVKYAFEDMAGGTIVLSIDRDDAGLLRLKVIDDGSGCPETASTGVGTRLIQSLVKQHNGSYQRVNRQQGCEVTITLAKKSLAA